MAFISLYKERHSREEPICTIPSVIVVTDKAYWNYWVKNKLLSNKTHFNRVGKVHIAIWRKSMQHATSCRCNYPYPEPVVFQWQSSVPGTYTPVHTGMSLDKELLVASVLPVVFQWLSSGLPMCSIRSGHFPACDPLCIQLYFKLAWMLLCMLNYMCRGVCGLSQSLLWCSSVGCKS